MAVANSIGSNIFEVLFCLSLPWLVDYLITNEPITIHGNMTFVCICLVISALIPLLTISMNSWVIDRKLGATLILMYILFIILDTYYEVQMSPAPCD